MDQKGPNSTHAALDEFTAGKVRKRSRPILNPFLQKRKLLSADFIWHFLSNISGALAKPAGNCLRDEITSYPNWNLIRVPATSEITIDPPMG